MRPKITSVFVSAEPYYNLISIRLCFKQTSNKYLLRAKHCSKCWECSGEGNRQNSLLCEAYSLTRKSEEQNKQLKYMLTTVKEWYKLREEKRGTLLLSVKSDWESHWAGQELKEMIEADMWTPEEECWGGDSSKCIGLAQKRDSKEAGVAGTQRWGGDEQEVTEETSRSNRTLQAIGRDCGV